MRGDSLIGKRMLLYNKPYDMFFAGYRHAKGCKEVPTWCKSISEAVVVSEVDAAVQYKENLGYGVRIVTEEEANEIRGDT